MKRELFVVYDRVARSTLGVIMQEPHAAPAIRTFNTVLADTRTQLGQHPKDFELLHIGSMDESGAILPAVPHAVATGEAWLAAQSDGSEEPFKVPQSVMDAATSDLIRRNT